MGCVNSRADINDLHPNVFQVMNVDDLGNLITPGRLEITESDIVLYQRGKPPVEWPLRCLRRYGYDSEIFSFESGRRCSTGPGIYAFKCRRADQLFNRVQVNIQVCNNSGDDAISRDLSVPGHSAPAITRMTIAPPVEANYLDPMPPRSSSRVTPRFSHSQQNGVGRLGSVSSSSGPMSPQGTMGSPSPPPNLPTAASLGVSSATIPQPSTCHPSAVYVNDRVLSVIAMEIELDNNNKSARRTMQRSHTVSSTSSGGFLQEPVTAMTTVNPETKKPHSRPPPLPSATYMNIDLSSEQSPLSPTQNTPNSGKLPREENTPNGEWTRHAYMNVSPGVDTTRADAAPSRVRPSVLFESHTSQQQHNHHPPPPPSPLPPPPPLSSASKNVGEQEDSALHCYANLEHAEIEELRIRYNGGDSVPGRMEKSSPHQLPPQIPTLPQSLSISLPYSTSATAVQQPATPPLSTEPIREVNYAVLDLDKNDASAASSVITALEHATNAVPSPPDSPNKPQKGYATIDFNKTAALSHSVNPNLVNDNEGSRKTRHNSTINELTAPSRHSSSMSE